MGIDDRAALATLHDAVAAPGFAARFFARWFHADPAVPAMFPADPGPQRTAFAHAIDWVFGELAAQRPEDLVTFLAQLGRDHRKYGVTEAHYNTAAAVLYATLGEALGPALTGAVDAAARDALKLITGVMSGAADAEEGPAFWEGTVVEYHRVAPQLGVVRMMLDAPLPYHPGQYVKVETPHRPRMWRYLSPAMPADGSGAIEFHVRAVPGGAVSPAIVADTAPGDRWRLSSPHGGLHVERTAGDVLMVAGSTGLAPLRAILLAMAQRVDNPRVHLFFGARYPCELYDLPLLWQIAVHNPWLSVTPVAEFHNDPPWAADYPDVTPPRGLHVRRTGRLPEVVTGFGGWGDRQILLCGGPEMTLATRAALIARGAPPERIQHDPLTG